MPVADPTVGQSNWGTALNARLDDIDLRAMQVLAPTASKTTAYTAAVGDHVLTDTTSAGFTVTLPASPADKSRIAIELAASAATTNALTYAAGAGDTLDPTLSGTLAVVGEVVLVQYQASTKVWRPEAARLPLSQLDTRYDGSYATYTPTFTNVTSGAGTFFFFISNKRLYVRGVFSAGTATAGGSIGIVLPLSKVAAASIAQVLAADNGAANPAPAPCRVAASATSITLWKSSGTAFTASDSLVNYTFNGVIEIQ